MKLLFFLLAFLSVVGKTLAQQVEESDMKSRYLQKSVRQKKAGTVLLITGTAIAVGGCIKVLGEMDDNILDPDRPQKLRTPGVLLITGGAVLASSAILFIAAKRNREHARAMTISFKSQTHLSVARLGLAKLSHPAIVMNIRF